MDVSKMVVPPKHPKMVIFSRKTHGCWVPLFSETPIYIIILHDMGLHPTAQARDVQSYQMLGLKPHDLIQTFPKTLIEEVWFG